MEIDKEKICKEYIESKIGVEALATKYHVGKLKIKGILAEAGITIKKRGAQSNNNDYKVNDWKIKKYQPVDGFHYIAIDRNSGFRTNDWENSAGVLTTHIKDVYGIDIPTLYDRRQYYMKTGNYWWEQWFDIKLEENIKTKKCPYCGWETIDVENKSGVFEQHLKEVHNITKEEYIKTHPEEINYFIGSSLQKNLQLDENKDNYVICKVCGRKLKRIDIHHLKTHGLTKKEYIDKYGDSELSSVNYHKVASKRMQDININATFHKTSQAETEIKEFIKSFGFEVKCDRTVLSGMEIDIYIPELKIGFEYNGCLYHSEQYGKDRYYHINKTQKCYEKDIMLYQIFEDDFYYHKDILFSKIQHILGKSNNQKIRAKECVITEISSHDSDVFLENNHIQGKSRATIYLGAFYKNKVVGVMLFTKEGGDNWNLVRFASDINYNITGIAGKLFSYFVKNYKNKEIKTFAERRFTPNISSNLYTKLGFSMSAIEPPDYRYYNSRIDRYKRFHKFGFRKQILHKKYGLPLTMTENEMVKELGYTKIWDCGLIKYVYKNQNYKE